jgi:WD40 repeat protein
MGRKMSGAARQTMLAFLRWLPFLILLAALGAATAAEPPTQPLLRVETGMHTTLIRRLVVDAPRNRLITCSDDKTIRVWQMPEARLVATLRVPMDQAHEGQLFGLAVSPDGRTVAAGGWTGWDWDGKASVYLFDIASGELTRRLGNFPDAIHAIAWSPDGKHLAVGLQGRAGLSVVRLADGQIIASDSQYLDKLTDLDFDRNGRIATVALDGMARLYDKDFRLLGRRIVPGGKKPIAVKFSPDAELLAIGYHDAPTVSVASARDLSLQRHADTRDISDQVNLITVVWSSDGQTLYAAGDYRGSGLNPLYRWRDKGNGKMEIVPLTANRIPEIQQMPNGRIAFAAEDPAFGIIGPTGKIEALRGPDIHDYSVTHGKLLVSADGAVIRYPARRDGSVMHSFSALSGGEQSPAAARTEPVAGPLLQAEGFVLENWQNAYNPRINGKVPQLDDYEMGRSYAFAPDGSTVLLGTEWALRLLDREAKERWSVKLAAVVWAVNVSANGQVAVAALSDGTLRWYRMRDGKELFAYFPHRNGQEWIAWLPSGYYISSIFGDNYVGWHVNRGKDETPDFYRAVQFDRVLYRPDVFLDAVQLALLPATRSLTARTPQAAEFDINRMQDIAPSRLRLRATGVTQLEGELQLQLQLSGTGGARPARDVAIFVNGIPVTPSTDRQVTQTAAGSFTRTFTVPLASRENAIRAESFNGISMGVAETFLAVPDFIQTKPRPGDLYLLAVGVNVFPGLSEDASLAFAAQDAEAISSAIAKHGPDQFRRMHLKLINDASADKPDRQTIVDALQFIQQAQAGDTVAIFLASHGISDTAGNYYFVPRDATAEDIERITAGGKIESLIPWTAFFDALRATPGRRLLIVDTCQARNIEGRFEAHSLMKRSAASQFSLMLASKGNEESQEHPTAKHGLFTYSLLQGMQAPAGRLTLPEWFAKTATILEKERDKRVGPQTPQLIVPPALNDMSLIRVR